MNQRRTSPFFIPDWEYFDFAPHVQQRMAQRNLSWEDIRFVLQHGQRWHKAGAIHVFLGSRDIPYELRNRFARLEGTTVLVNPDSMDMIITVYRNRQRGTNQIRRKRKQRRKIHKAHPLPNYLC